MTAVRPVAVRIAGVGRRIAGHDVLDAIDIDVAPGELLALTGPSGCGKTSLLRIIAGLDRPDRGTLLVDDIDAATLAPPLRRTGFVFQHHALFPHMDVAANVAFGLTGQADAAARVEAMLALVGLEGFGSRRPGSLSGGESQRVALARALAPEPRLLLLDEPFAALDPGTRGAMRALVATLHRDRGLTTILVTHDRADALALADRIAEMRDGRIARIAAPDELRAETGWP